MILDFKAYEECSNRLLNEILHLRAALDLSVEFLNKRIAPEFYTTEAFYNYAHTKAAGLAPHTVPPVDGGLAGTHDLVPYIFLKGKKKEE